MHCSKCNQELDETGKCSYCEAQEAETVRVLTPEERAGYQGVTIDTANDNDQAGEQRTHYNNNSYQHIYVKNISTISSSSWLSKILIILVVAAIASFLLFVALPVALIGIGVGIVVWLVLSFFRR